MPSLRAHRRACDGSHHRRWKFVVLKSRDMPISTPTFGRRSRKGMPASIIASATTSNMRSC